MIILMSSWNVVCFRMNLFSSFVAKICSENKFFPHSLIILSPCFLEICPPLSALIWKGSWILNFNVPLIYSYYKRSFFLLYGWIGCHKTDRAMIILISMRFYFTVDTIHLKQFSPFSLLLLLSYETLLWYFLFWHTFSFFLVGTNELALHGETMKINIHAIREWMNQENMRCLVRFGGIILTKWSPDEQLSLASMGGFICCSFPSYPLLHS